MIKILLSILYGLFISFLLYSNIIELNITVGALAGFAFFIIINDNL